MMTDTPVATIINPDPQNHIEAQLQHLNVLYGYSRRQGHRPYQEDRFDIVDDDKQHEFMLLGVFDGHGGSRFSKHAKENMFDLILNDKSYFDNGQYVDALANGFLQEDEKMKEIDTEEHGGTTATVALIVKNKLYLANVGDSRSVLAQATPNGLHAIRLSKDHGLYDPEEKQRVEQVGGVIQGERVVEQGHAINMTRALGDFEFKTDNVKECVMSPIPHIASISLNPSHQFLVLASDGLWDFMDGDDAVVRTISQQLSEGMSPQQITDRLTEKISPKGGSDNITVILAVFQFAQNGAPKTI